MCLCVWIIVPNRGSCLPLLNWMMSKQLMAFSCWACVNIIVVQFAGSIAPFRVNIIYKSNEQITFTYTLIRRLPVTKWAWCTWTHKYYKYIYTFNPKATYWEIWPSVCCNCSMPFLFALHESETIIFAFITLKVWSSSMKPCVGCCAYAACNMWWLFQIFSNFAFGTWNYILIISIGRDKSFWVFGEIIDACIIK